jgi:DNA-binding transcriptional MerR regulator
LGDGVEASMLIGELSERTGASVRSLRHYESNGLLIAGRGSNGYREFPASAVETVARIRALLAAGLPVATIRQVLPCTLDATPRVQPCDVLTATLRGEMRRLETRAAQLDRARTIIAGMLATEPAAGPAPGERAVAGPAPGEFAAAGPAPGEFAAGGSMAAV